MEVEPITRRQRRSQRIKKLLTDQEAHRAALKAGLDYRVSGETGAMIVHTHSMSWHRAQRPNVAMPPEGRGWDRSSRPRVVLESEDRNRQPVNQV